MIKRISKFIIWIFMLNICLSGCTKQYPTSFWGAHFKNDNDICTVMTVCYNNEIMIFAEIRYNAQDNDGKGWGIYERSEVGKDNRRYTIREENKDISPEIPFRSGVYIIEGTDMLFYEKKIDENGSDNFLKYMKEQEKQNIGNKDIKERILTYFGINNKPTIIKLKGSTSGSSR